MFILLLPGTYAQIGTIIKKQMQDHRTIATNALTDNSSSGSSLSKEPGRFLFLGLFFAAFLSLSLITRTVLIVKYLRLIDAKPLLFLNVKKKNDFYQLDRETRKTGTASPDQVLLDETISYYQGASYLFEHRLNRFEAEAAGHVR